MKADRRTNNALQKGKKKTKATSKPKQCRR